MMIGIDLGTTNSLAAVFRNGRAEVIPNRLGQELTPSVISVDENGVLLVGETAREYGRSHPLDTARLFKRSMGTEKEYKLRGKTYRSEDLSALILRSLKEDAEHYLGEPVTEAIISVPAYFNDFQRKATRQAGELAGLTVSRIISEPTAAAIAYGVGSEQKSERCLVFDLGGGTFDVSILEFYGTIMEVHAIAGDNFIGGEDFTALLAQMYLEKSMIAPETLDVVTMNQVMKEAERAKCAFCEKNEVTLSCHIQGEVVEQTISLERYKAKCEPLLERIRRPIERSMRDAKMKLSDIDRVILVGGATKLPVIRHFVIKLFRSIPSLAFEPDLAIALGAALQCGMKQRNEEIQEVILTDVCPFTLGTEVSVDNGMFDEAGHYLPIIERNTVIPVSRTQTVYTAHDNQSRVTVRILQGESRMARNNISLGEITIPVPPGPKGKEAVRITYTYDINSLLEAEVCVLSTGESRKIVIQSGEHQMSEEDVEKRMETLSYLKRDPREAEENRLAILRGERLYEEALNIDRSYIDQALMEFDRVLNRQDRKEIEDARRKLMKLLDRIEFGI